MPQRPVPLHPGAVTRGIPVLMLGAMLAACGGTSSTSHGGSPGADQPATTGASSTTSAGSSSASATATATPQSATPTPGGSEGTQGTQQSTQGSQGTRQAPTPRPMAPPPAKPPSKPPSSGTPKTPAPPALSWNLVVYYTPVETYYGGATQSITGCGPDAPDSCSKGTTALGSYPSSFLTAVQNIDDGRITSGQYAGDYLSWDDDTGWDIDTTLTDDNDNPMQPFVTAQADVPVGTHFQVTSCGTQGGAAVADSVCSQLLNHLWTVTDSNDGDTANEVDLYVGVQDSPTFASSALATLDSTGAHTTLPAPIANDSN
jgi:hypothetical protein